MTLGSDQRFGPHNNKVSDYEFRKRVQAITLIKTAEDCVCVCVLMCGFEDMSVLVTPTKFTSPDLFPKKIKINF